MEWNKKIKRKVAYGILASSVSVVPLTIVALLTKIFIDDLGLSMGVADFLVAALILSVIAIYTALMALLFGTPVYLLLKHKNLMHPMYFVFWGALGGVIFGFFFKSNFELKPMLLFILYGSYASLFYRYGASKVKM